MSTEYSNRDKLEDFYKKKFDEFTVEPLPYAFDKINENLAKSPTVYAAFRSIFANRIKLSLLLSVLINIALIFWIWNGEHKSRETTTEVSAKPLIRNNATAKKFDSPRNEIKVNNIGAAEGKIEKKVEARKEKRATKTIKLNPGDQPKRADTYVGPHDKNESTEINLVKDTVELSAPIKQAPQDFKSNLEKYSQQKSTQLKDSARELFLRKK
jgi:hypothetical protein